MFSQKGKAIMQVRQPSVQPPRISQKFCVAGFFLMLGLFLQSGCKEGAQSPQRPAPPPPEVIVTSVIQRDVPIYFEWVGTTAGYVNAKIHPRVQGYLYARHYKEGAAIKAGDLMFTIDPREYQAALDQAMGNLAQAEANLGKTQLDVARYTPLAKGGAISQQELDNAVQANQANKALVEAARATVEQAKLNLGWTKVTSPIDGIAGIAVAQIGDLVTPNTELTTVSQVDPIKVYYPISEREYLHFARRIREIGQGDGGEKVPLELTLADGSVYPERGTFSLADRQVDIRTGTITVQGLFPNPGNLLRPGQYAKIRVAAEMKKGALLVPQRAVQELQGTYRLAIVGPDNKVTMRVVQVGERVGDLWIIEEGLKPDERVVIEGLQKIRDGALVNPQPAATEAAAQGSSLSTSPSSSAATPAMAKTEEK